MLFRVSYVEVIIDFLLHKWHEGTLREEISVVTEFGEYRGSVSKKQSYAKGYIFVEFSKLNSSKKCIIKLLIQFLIYLFRSYK